MATKKSVKKSPSTPKKEAKSAKKQPRKSSSGETSNSKLQKDKIKTLFSTDYIIAEDSNEARELYNQSRFGGMSEEGNISLSLIEAYFLLEKEKIIVLDGRNRPMAKENFLKRAKKLIPNFLVKYSVFRDMRSRGYIVKTALKFGADFRVYDRGVKPGEDHAKWVLFPVHESEALTWHGFAAKNRVAHSTKKRLLLGIVDEELDVTYYEIKWIRP